MSNMTRRGTAGLVAAAALAVGTAGLAYANGTFTAAADTDGCVSLGEVDAYHDGMTRTEVWQLFDIYGAVVGDTASGDGYRVKYVPTCWAPGEKKVVVAFDYSSGESIWLDVRDV